MSTNPVRFKPIREVGSKYLGTKWYIVEQHPQMFIDEQVMEIRKEMIRWCFDMVDPTWAFNPAWDERCNASIFEFRRNSDAMNFYLRWQGATA